jgi:hypothetical protein
MAADHEPDICAISDQDGVIDSKQVMAMGSKH